MKLKLAALAVILAAGAIAAVFYLRTGKKPRHPRRPPAQPDDHAALMAPVQAMLEAPEGATPCESAYLAIQAEQAAAKAKGVASFFARVAPRDEFLGLCNALPAESQPCMVPKYATFHRPECEAARPPDGALKGMFEARPTNDPIEQKNLEHLFGAPDAGRP